VYLVDVFAPGSYHEMISLVHALAALPAGGNSDDVINPVLPPEPAGKHLARPEMTYHLDWLTEFLHRIPPPFDRMMVYICSPVKSETNVQGLYETPPPLIGSRP